MTGLENPADSLSRSLPLAKLVDYPLRFSGPLWASWIRLNRRLPLTELDHDSVGEVPQFKSLARRNCRCSRMTALFSRAANFVVVKTIANSLYISHIKTKPRAATLTWSDPEFDGNKIQKNLQNIQFSEDIDKIKNNKYCSPPLQKLKPFLDKNGLVRVGGRLSKAGLEYSQKHPVVLPRRDHVVNLIVEYFHRK